MKWTAVFKRIDAPMTLTVEVESDSEEMAAIYAKLQAQTLLTPMGLGLLMDSGDWERISLVKDV